MFSLRRCVASNVHAVYTTRSTRTCRSYELRRTRDFRLKCLDHCKIDSVLPTRTGVVRLTLPSPSSCTRFTPVSFLGGPFQPPLHRVWGLLVGSSPTTQGLGLQTTNHDTCHTLHSLCLRLSGLSSDGGRVRRPQVQSPTPLVPLSRSWSPGTFRRNPPPQPHRPSPPVLLVHVSHPMQSFPLPCLVVDARFGGPLCDTQEGFYTVTVPTGSRLSLVLEVLRLAPRRRDTVGTRRHHWSIREE